jgi:capsular exopolysaccharide synthesis family protein
VNEPPLPVPVPAVPPAAASAIPPGLSAGPTVGGLLAALRRRLVPALAVAAGGAALTVVAVFLLMPARFVAQSQIKLTPPNQEGVIWDKRNINAVDDPTAWKSNQEGIFKSPLVLDRALRGARAKGLAAPYTTESLAKALKVDFLIAPHIMRVVFTGDDDESIAPLLNEIVQSYLDQVHEEELERRTKLLKAIEKTQQEYLGRLRTLKDSLRREEQRVGYDPETAKIRLQAALSNRQMAGNNLLLLQTELAKKERELRTTQTRLKNIDTEPIPLPDVIKHLANSPGVQGQLTRIRDIDLYIAEIKSKLPKRRHAEALRSPLAERQEELHALEKLYQQLRPAAEEELRAVLNDTLRIDIGRLENEVAGLKTHVEASALALTKVDDEIKRLEPGNLPRNELMDKLRTDIEQNSEALRNVSTQINKLKVEPIAQARAQILERAERPTSPDTSRQVKVGGGAGIAMFGLLLFGMAFLEFRNRKVNSADEVSQGLGLKVLGTLPALPARLRRAGPGSLTPADQQLQNQVAEAVDALRTVLLHQARSGGAQVVMVTSADGGEGKTSLASQLAASLARAWRKTLLVDGDLRNPAAHKLFDVPLEPGLSEVLRSEATVGDVVRPTPLSRLWMVPAGHWDSHAVQALAQDGVRTTLAQLKSQYEFIVVDSSPVLPVADSLLLAQHVDGVIFSVLRDVSRLPAVHAAHQRLGALGVQVLGAVMIGVRGDAPSLGKQYPAASSH